MTSHEHRKDNQVGRLTSRERDLNNFLKYCIAAEDVDPPAKQTRKLPVVMMWCDNDAVVE